MNSLFIKSLVNTVDTKTLVFHGVISPDNFSKNLWEEDLIKVSFLDNTLTFTNLYLEEFKNFKPYSKINFSIEDILGNIKLEQTLSIYELSSLNSILKSISIENNDILKFTLKSFTLNKDVNNNILEHSDEAFLFFTFDHSDIKPLSYADYEKIKKTSKTFSSKEQRINISVLNKSLSKDSFIKNSASNFNAIITSKNIIPLYFHKKGLINLKIKSSSLDKFSLYLGNSSDMLFLNSFKFNDEYTLTLPSEGFLSIETSTDTLDSEPLCVELSPITTKYTELKTLLFSKNSFFLERAESTSPSICKIIKTNYFNLVLFHATDFDITSLDLTDLIQRSIFDELIINP
ncbi:MAG: hypothetical protein ACRC28_10200 [Clostridium sp.]|uniref:hypothetical protein n=1 Tax=Clostridium sp. TaxID=1506 RepID=UPI003F363F4D